MCCIADSDNNFKRCRTYISPRPYIDKRELIAAVRVLYPSVTRTCAL
jgi:hypothetical protein